MPAANSPFSALSTLTLACVLFAASVAIKQHNVTVAAVSGLVLLDHCRRGRVPIRPLIVAGGMGLALLVAYLSGENLLTSGRMWKTVFVYPSGPFRAINYAGWRHVGSIFDIVARRSVGLIALAGVAAVALRGRLVANKVDRLILLFLLVEIGTLVPLCLFNAGAAYNYALQAIVFASVMVARSLDRVFDTLAACPVGLRRTGELGLACGAALLGLADVHWIVQSESLRRQEAQALATIAADPRLAPRPADERYFVSRQHLNRLQGNTSLIHDDWLYGAFEQAADVEPRQEWLRSRLTAGPITQVVVPGDMQRVPGIAEPLSDLGYQPVTRAGGLTVWQRSALPHNE